MKVWKFVITIIGGFYAVLWKATLGRPWTYAIREAVSTHKGIAAIVILITVVMALVSMRFFHQWYAIGLQAFYWSLLSHCLWDTAGAYIKPVRYKKR